MTLPTPGLACSILSNPGRAESIVSLQTPGSRELNLGPSAKNTILFLPYRSSGVAAARGKMTIFSACWACYEPLYYTVANLWVAPDFNMPLKNRLYDTMFCHKTYCSSLRREYLNLCVCGYTVRIPADIAVGAATAFEIFGKLEPTSLYVLSHSAHSYYAPIFGEHKPVSALCSYLWRLTPATSSDKGYKMTREQSLPLLMVKDICITESWGQRKSQNEYNFLPRKENVTFYQSVSNIQTVVLIRRHKRAFYLDYSL